MKLIRNARSSAGKHANYFVLYFATKDHHASIDAKFETVLALFTFQFTYIVFDVVKALVDNFMLTSTSDKVFT